MKTELLLAAFNAALSAPEDQLYLNAVIRPHGAYGLSCDVLNRAERTTSCGTIACALGWAMLDPTLNAAGLSYSGNPIRPICVDGDSYYGSNFDLAASLFFDISVEDAQLLFSAAGDSRYDPDLIREALSEGARGLTHQKLFEGRVKQFRAKHGF